MPTKNNHNTCKFSSWLFAFPWYSLNFTALTLTDCTNPDYPNFQGLKYWTVNGHDWLNSTSCLSKISFFFIYFSKSGAVFFFSLGQIKRVCFRHLERVRKTRKNENDINKHFCHFLLIIQALLNVHFQPSNHIFVEWY